MLFVCTELVNDADIRVLCYVSSHCRRLSTVALQVISVIISLLVLSEFICGMLGAFYHEGHFIIPFLFTSVSCLLVALRLILNPIYR